MIHLRRIPAGGNDLRYSIFKDRDYIGNITVYPVSPQTVTYGILIISSRRNQGYGKAALHCLLDELRQLGYQRIIARVRSDNQASLAFHHRAGFKVLEKTEDDIWSFEYDLQV